MGQSSSQLESTQADDAVNAEEAGQVSNPPSLDVVSTTDAHQPVATPQEEHKMEASPAARKHPRSSDSNGEDSPHRVKKSKTSHEHAQKKKPTTGRSVPQQRRGTAIMPRHNATQDRRELKVHAESAPTPPRPQSSSSSEGEFFDASSVVFSGTPKNEDKMRVRPPVDEVVGKPAQQDEPPQTNPEQDFIEANHDDDDQGAMQIDDSLVSAVGRPGPRRPKKTKKKQHLVEDVQNLDQPIDDEPVQDAPAIIVEEPPVSSEAPAAKPSARSKKVKSAKKDSTKSKKQQLENAMPGNKVTVAPPTDQPTQAARKRSRPSNESQKAMDAKLHEREEAAKYAILTQRVKDLQNNPEFERRSGDMLRAQQSLHGDPVRQAAVKEKFFMEWGISLKHIVLPKDWDKTHEEQNDDAVDEQEMVPDSQPAEKPPAENMPNAVVPATAPAPAEVPTDTQKESVAVGAASKPAKKRRRRPNKNVATDNQHVTEPAPVEQPETAPSPPSAPAVPADRIPTPPTSLEQANPVNNGVVEADPNFNDVVLDDGDDNDPNYDARDREGYVDPGNKIATWLDNEETPVPPDQVGPSRGSPEKSKKTSSKPNNRASAPHDDGNDEYQHDMDDVDSDLELDDDAPQPKKRRQSNPAQRKKRDPNQTKAPPAVSDDQRGTLAGAWSKEEKAFADSVFYDHLKRIGHTEWNEFELRNSFVDWKDATPPAFKQALFSAFPLRAKKAIREFCKRRFRIWKTGPWTEEEDEKLVESYEYHQGAWEWVGDDLNRSAQACRDRWTSVVQFGAKVEKGPWTTEEEENLREVVEAFLDELKKEWRAKGPDNTDDIISEKSIEWAKITTRLEKLRNARQCRDKWKALKTRAANGLDATLQSMTAKPAEERGGLSRKQKDDDRAYSKLGWADVYDALQEIITAAKSTSNLSTEFTLESTFWAMVAMNTMNSDSRFPSRLRRRCYYGAMEKFGNELIEDSLGFGYRAVLLAEAMVDAESKGDIEWKRTMEGRIKKKVVAEPKNTAPAAAATARNEQRGTHLRPADATARPASRDKFLSEEFIVNSDDEEEPEATNDNDNQDAVAGAEREEEQPEEELVDELPISSLNSRYEDSLHHSTPALKPRDFIQRCQGMTRALHRRLDTVREAGD